MRDARLFCLLCIGSLHCVFFFFLLVCSENAVNWQTLRRLVSCKDDPRQEKVSSSTRRRTEVGAVAGAIGGRPGQKATTVLALILL